MKILMMTNTYFPLVGGIEQSIRLFCDEFRRLGHEVLIAAPSYEGKAEDEEHVIRVPALRKFYKTDFSVNLPVPGLFPKIMRTLSPDIVHSHHPFFMGDFALRLSRQYHRPLVFTYHIMVERYVHYLPIQNEGVKRFVIEIAAGYANLADQVIVPSQSVRDILFDRGVVSPIEVIPTGVDLEWFSNGREAPSPRPEVRRGGGAFGRGSNGADFRQRSGIPPEAFVIGHVGRLAPEKNLDFLVNCLIEFLKKEVNAHVLMVGQGPSQKMIKAAFERSGLGERLHLTGFLYKKDLVDAYFSMDVFAFASLSETQGVVLLEAMAAGVPVVTVDAPGVREAVKDHFNGRVIGDPDQRKFVDALAGIAHCPPEELRTLKQHAKETVKDYSMSSCAKRMLEVYEDLRRKEIDPLRRNDSSWYMLKGRLKAEWDMFKNLIEASEAALMERSPSPSEKTAAK
ncbi:MAG: glycosyltransferase [Candidatus Omnitrophica bacterium]|nr:glycosyltransferase [Candidatus Omnitrophota bacterium]